MWLCFLVIVVSRLCSQSFSWSWVPWPLSQELHVGLKGQPAQCQPPTLPHRYIWRPQSVRRCLKVFEGLTHFNTVEHAEIKDRFETPSPKTKIKNAWEIVSSKHLMILMHFCTWSSWQVLIKFRWSIRNVSTLADICGILHCHYWCAALFC